jgi:hypothetical protein
MRVEAMDYRKFLGKKQTLVLPYLGGTSVDTRTRRLRVKGEPSPGWWSFEVEGRHAHAIEAAEPEAMDDLPAVRGHLVGRWLFASGREAARLQLMPSEEPAMLSPAIGRRWSSQALLFESLDFEQDAEEQAREQLERDGHVAELKSLPASLRAAFGYAVIARVSRHLQIPASPHEVLGQLRHVAERGRPAAVGALENLAEQRRLERIRQASWHGRPQHAAPPPDPEHDLDRRLEAALRHANAELASHRRLDAEQSEVAFRFMDERFIAVVDSRSLRVLDAGICLSGADRELTLDSLPSAIREAIDTDQLYITRHG